MIPESVLRKMSLGENLLVGKELVTRVLGGWIYAARGVFVPEFRPSQWYPVVLAKDGDMWCCMYGPNIQEGIAGFGSTPDEACKDFDERWYKK